MGSSTSIGNGPDRGGNENHDGDPRRKTLGETAPPDEPPEGAEGLLGQAAPDVPAGVPGAPAQPGVRKGPQSFPDGPNVESSPWELEAARGHVPKDR